LQVASNADASTMGITQKYSLKWNDFTVNVASTFRDLHARQDFVDVTLACADGSTLEAHKVVLSSVSSYFRDILKQTPCKHPIIILKDTPRDEASAMLEFAYTGEVNVAQELLPALLHTARAFRIKGLDKVESPVADNAAAADPSASNPVLPPPPRWELAGSHPGAAAAAAGATSPDDSVTKPQSGAGGGEHFLAAADKLPSAANPVLNVNGRREREVSPPPAHSRPGSRPPTRENSPCPTSGSSNSARTPPPKRWKRSFDMSGAVAHAQQQPKTEPAETQPLPMIAENYSTTANRQQTEFEPSKQQQADSADRRSLPYPHSMPTSPTMFERGNESRLAGLFRHHLANGGAPVAAHSSQRPDSTAAAQENGNGSASNGSDDALDYSRCYNGQSKSSSQSESDYSTTRNGHPTGTTVSTLPPPPQQQQQPSSEAAAAAAAAEAAERYRRSGSLSVFRPESAPTVLDMSPENSLSGPPSSVGRGGGGNVDLDRSVSNGNGEMDADQSVGAVDDIDCVTGKAFTLTPDAMGRYNCDECGKFFKHPGSLQHHRHIHRGTHRCPSCGKAFSRRWDMERHLNKSKYGCPANRFSTGSAGSSGSSSGGGSAGGAGGNLALAAAAAAAAAAANGQPGQSHIEMLAAASSVAAAAAQQQSVSVHNTTA